MALQIEKVQLDRLVEKYSRQGPRYTSYPTAVEFHEGVDANAWPEILQADPALNSQQQEQSDAENALSLYFHLPFCSSLCYFCACNKVITKDTSVVPPYLEALLSEIEMYRALIGGKQSIEQIHWGGGSPNYLTAQQMEILHTATLKAFPNLKSDTDVSIEIDPRETTGEQLKRLVDLGFRRLSLGVQDFNPHVQTVINRVQPYEMTKKICDEARSFGFQGINIDLIYGLPEQTLSGFQETLKQLMTIRPDRVALYGYAHVTWLTKVQKSFERSRLPSPRERIEIFCEAVKTFLDEGYVYIGMDHFALPTDDLAVSLKKGKLNRNFMGYTSHRGARLLGLGVSAISCLPSAFAQNVKDILDYQSKILSGSFAIQRGLIRTPDDQACGEIIERVLCEGHFNIPDWEARWGTSFSGRFASSSKLLQSFEDDGLIEHTSTELSLTSIGRLFSRNVAMAFDAYLEKHQGEGKKVFSQAV